ncbi:hypothetical protein FB45DRAFT_870638 [Roridomyces roridus]|uniref:Uncharacterized protein n=1 Tax=Roridomyces roridus TaxID=1738132 RepID=A0AAD7BJH1_9AGAR|nr:hypothetical protein FB45DRAFT_870638 [Roridomyces roridus]
MVGNKWTSAEQAEWLQKRVPKYIEAQAGKTFFKFWANLEVDWFQQWPEEVVLGLAVQTGEDDTTPLLESDQALLQGAIQLRTWYRHHSKKASGAAVSQRKSTSSLTNTLFPPKKHRVHRPKELFQKVNAEKIAAAIEDAVVDSDDDDDDDEGTTESAQPSQSLEGPEPAEESQPAKFALQRKRMVARNHVVTQLFDEATEEELAELDRMIEEEKEAYAKAEAERVISKGEVSVRTPQEYQSGIDASGGALAHVHNAVAEQTGWVGFAIYGGPNPKFGGKLSMKYNDWTGGITGTGFLAALKDFDEAICQPFQAFLRRVYREWHQQPNDTPRLTSTSSRC